ncbi:DUF2934 domain-containing protein [Kordiimonas lipolytica]|uniref:DUF2934 domain-containing protein n=1 Tax=Kordiimonas lipolytica TaxID=1662421 RepID=A0ABV8U7G6_9PROT|nr:DUF2934 domain-containing protein [Kordiimonas lipolytica]
MTIPPYEQIAKRSYLIWEEEGCPHGYDIDHWLQAESELKALFNPPPRAPGSSPEKRPKTKAAKAKRAAAPRKVKASQADVS